MILKRNNIDYYLIALECGSQPLIQSDWNRKLDWIKIEIETRNY